MVTLPSGINETATDQYIADKPSDAKDEAEATADEWTCRYSITVEERNLHSLARCPSRSFSRLRRVKSSLSPDVGHFTEYRLRDWLMTARQLSKSREDSVYRTKLAEQAER